MRKDKGDDQQDTVVGEGRGYDQESRPSLKLSTRRSLPGVREAAANHRFIDQSRRAADDQRRPPHTNSYQSQGSCNLGNN